MATPLKVFPAPPAIVALATTTVVTAVQALPALVAVSVVAALVVVEAMALPPRLLRLPRHDLIPLLN